MIAIVADDLTGAADAGLGFRQAGFSTTVIQIDALAAGLREAVGVVAIDTRTRSAGAAEAIARTTQVVSAMRAAGSTTLYKKMDSTLRGHIAGELTAALAAWHPDAVAIVAPAFPRAGRTMREGVLHVNGQAADGPTLRGVLQAAGIAAASASVDVVRAGRLAALLQEPRGSDRRPRAIVCDAETHDDLDAIACAGLTVGSRAVWAASGGIAPALAAHLPEPRGSNPQRPIAASGPILTVVGSWSAIATEQVRHLQATGARTCVFAISALDGRDAALAARCVAEVLMHLRRAEDVIVTLPAVNAPVASAGGERLVARLGTLLRPAADLVGGLILAGGDTAVGLLRAWGIEALRIAGEIDAGIPVSVGSGGRPIPIVTKAGAFGGPGSLTLARDRLRRLGA